MIGLLSGLGAYFGLDKLSSAFGGSGDSFSTKISDLLTGGAASANQLTKQNNAWSQSFAENERDYQRNTIDPFNMQMTKDAFEWQKSQDLYNRNALENQYQIQMDSASRAGLNPLSLNGGSSSAGNSSVSAGNVNSSGASSPALGQLQTFANITQALSPFLQLAQSKYVADAQIKQAAYNADTDRLAVLANALNNGISSTDDLANTLNIDDSNINTKSKAASILNTKSNTALNYAHVNKSNQDIRQSKVAISKMLSETNLIDKQMAQILLQNNLLTEEAGYKAAQTENVKGETKYQSSDRAWKRTNIILDFLGSIVGSAARYGAAK